MVQRLLIFCLLCVFTGQLIAQDCVPDELYRDSAFAIVPLPRSDDNPDAGINTPACLNENYSFTFTFKIPLEVSVGGFTVPIDSVLLDKNDPNTITGQPNGIGYSCNPPSCNFDPREDSLVCVVLHGIPDDELKDYPLKIKIQLYNPIIPPFYPLDFPNTTLDGFDGDYTIELREEGSCQGTTSVSDLANEFAIKAQPNPFSYATQISIGAQREELMDMTVIDLLGKVVHQRQIQLLNGENQINFDGSQLTNGIYYLNLYNERGQVSKKLVIQR